MVVWMVACGLWAVGRGPWAGCAEGLTAGRKLAGPRRWRGTHMTNWRRATPSETKEGCESCATCSVRRSESVAFIRAAITSDD